LSVIIGEDELAAGKVKIKENGLRDGHPEKEGVLVNLSDLVSEVKQRIQRKAELDSITQEAEGLRVVGGVKGEPKKSEEGAMETEKPATENHLSQESIPAS
jgi:histidyl-tRNA synthetase